MKNTKGEYYELVVLGASGFTVLLVIRGARKRFFRTAVSMVSMILVLLIVSWINPYVGEFYGKALRYMILFRKTVSGF